MPSAKLALVGALTAALLAACGNSTKPEAGTLNAITTAYKGIDDPRKKHIQCLQQDHISVVMVGTTGMQIDTKPYGPTVQFEPTSGAAQELRIAGQVQGAEVIGSALLYPNHASDKLLKTVEACVAQGVSG